MQALHLLRARARLRLRQLWRQFPHMTRIAAPVLPHQKPPSLTACFPRAAKRRLHNRVTRSAHHLMHWECRCTRTYDFNNRDFRDRTISMFEFKPVRYVDQSASWVSIRSTNAAADLTMLSGLITRRTVGVLSIVRWKRNHDANGMDRMCDKERSDRSITTRPNPPP